MSFPTDGGMLNLSWNYLIRCTSGSIRETEVERKAGQVSDDRSAAGAASGPGRVRDGGRDMKYARVPAGGRARRSAARPRESRRDRGAPCARGAVARRTWTFVVQTAARRRRAAELFGGRAASDEQIRTNFVRRVLCGRCALASSAYTNQTFFNSFSPRPAIFPDTS